MAEASHGPVAGVGASRAPAVAGAATPAPVAAAGTAGPEGGYRSGPPASEFPPPGSAMNEGARPALPQKPDQKPARKTSPRRRKDDVPDDDEF